LEDGTFDLIYAISVFTHLDEDLQHVWLGELQRVARPGAVCIFSVQGDYVLSLIDPVYQEQIRKYGFGFLTGATGKLKLDGLPDFYQTTYHTRQYIERDWSKYFDILAYIERGINNHQDAVVLRKS
jgi:ubiquinone/menaquinone biosynthesis C-methylase UbiE